MLAHLATLLLLSASALATPIMGGGGDTNSCNGGQVQCCNEVQQPNAITPIASNLLGLAGLNLGQIAVPIALDCTSVNVIGVGGGSQCSNQQVCCTDNNYGGLVAVGCTPINVGV